MTPRIPGIEIGEELGHGAYSIVYRARQDETECALKLPRFGGQWTRWVYREAVALARVRHPALPQVFEVGEAGGLPYLLMELVEGETLADRLRGRVLTPEQALDTGCQLAEALRALHGIGLVHRDVKPRNIIIESSGRARLVDLGFAVPVGAGTVRDEAGTRLYSAPEQFEAAARVDGRADLYALGRVLAECLGGEMTLRHEPSVVIAGLAGAGVPTPVVRIVAALTSTTPAQRYPDAQALLSELHRVRAGGVPQGPQAFEPARLQPRLVGREAELERFTATWRHVGSGGGALIHVEGVSGTGKTRFIQACSKMVRDEGRGRAIEAGCHDGDPPLSAIRRLLQSYVASVQRLPPQDKAAAITALRAAALGPLEAIASTIAPEVAALLDAPHQFTVPDAFAEGAVEFIIRLCRRSGPLLLQIDDIQWIDPVSARVVWTLADRVREAPLAVLLAGRPGGSPVLDTGAHCVRITLGTLELRQTSALIAAHLGAPHLDAGIVRRIAKLTELTPVGVLEVLGAHLDAGAIRLHHRQWVLHEPSAELVELPRDSRAYLGRRLKDLPQATRRVLEMAAILGTTFEEELLARSIRLRTEDVEYALADGRLLGLLEVDSRERHRFAHDSLREMLLGALDETTRRRLHQQAAVALLALEEPTPEQAYACALHFADGELASDPAGAYRAARRAADVAVDAYDDETALSFLATARTHAAVANLALDVSFHRRVGDASVRVGALDDAVRAFEDALDMASERVARASLWGRMAWVRRARSEPDRAWEALEEAFTELGLQLPTESAEPSAGRAQRVEVAPEALDTLFELYHQHTRLALESGRAARAMVSAMRVMELGGSSGPSLALVRAHATYGAAMVFAGHKREGERELGIAQRMALQVGDPAVNAFYLARRSVAFVFTGDFDAALELFRVIADEYAPWVEVAALCDILASADFIESIRGRAQEAGAWITRAIDRMRRRQQTASPFPGLFAIRARAALATLGRQGQEGPWLAAQIAAANEGRGEKAFYRMLCWGPRARHLLDTGNLGETFEKLVTDFRQEGHRAGAGHVGLVEYYIAVAHGRLQQCLSAGQGDRSQPLSALRQAAEDLRAAAQHPLVLAHSCLVDGALAWFEGKGAAAQRLLSKAEALASSESCPWVSWAVARIRAHMLRAKRKLGAAMDQARLAELLARTHGAVTRAATVRAEFGLPLPEPQASTAGAASSGHRSSHRARRQLTSLLQLVRTPYGELEPAQQAVAILDDLIRELAADRGYLLFDADDAMIEGHERVYAGRTRLGENVAPTNDWRDEMMRAARAEAPLSEGILPHMTVSRPRVPDRIRAIALPLVLHERPAGAVLIERAATDPPFTTDDHELLLVLSYQVPLGLELARLLADRDGLQVSVRRVQKMEVVGQLAGSVAHDLNNMLAVIRTSFYQLGESDHLSHSERDELSAAQEAERRATRLAAKLLSLSSQQTMCLESRDINAALLELQPMLQRAAPRSDGFTVKLELANHALHALTDVGSFEQAILNLAINARDAMPGGGTMTITTRTTTLGPDAVLRGAPAEGEYAEIEVHDTGEGIPPQVMDRIFDPFFTTKPAGKGTGLGLTSVFAFARQCAGHVEVESEVGRGTRFHLFIPRSTTVALTTPAQFQRASADDPPAAILVVDADAAVRTATCHVLQTAGYRVLVAPGEQEAARLLVAVGDEISLVILNVEHVDRARTELGRRLRPTAKFLVATEPASPEGPLLHGSLSNEDLLGRVRTMLKEGLN